MPTRRTPPLHRSTLRLRRSALWAVVVAVAAVLVAPSTAAPVPEGAEHSEEYFPSADGTMLHADVYRPAGRRGRVPVILLVSPYTGTMGVDEGPALNYETFLADGDIFSRGYAWVQVSLRGVGGSGGCGDMGGKGEQADVKAAVEWAASQPWSTGKVGMWGLSYDAWTQVMALATKPRGLAAAVIASPLIDFYRGLYMNGVHYHTLWHGATATYGAFDMAPPSVFAPPQQHVNAVTGTATNPRCFAMNVAESAQPDRSSSFWEERNLVPRASGSTVPVLWSHGFLDANTKPDNFLDVWSTLRGPHRGRFGQFTHVEMNSATIGRDTGLEQALAWFDRHLRGGRRPITDAPVEVQQGDGRWRAERAWPPADARVHHLPLRPGSYRDVPGNNAVSDYGNNGGVPDRTGVGTWTFTQALPYDVHLAGVARLRAEVDVEVPGAHVVALVYDVDPEGEARLVTRGASTIRGDGEVSFDLYPQDWRLPAGHHLAVLLSGADDMWFDPGHTGTTVTVREGMLSAPFLRFDRDLERYLPGDEGAHLERQGHAPVDGDTIRSSTLRSPLPPRMTRRPRR